MGSPQHAHRFSSSDDGTRLISLNRSLFHEALDILEVSECHPGALCRSAFALFEAYDQCGDSHAAMRYELVGISHREKIRDVPASHLGKNPSEYDRFVSVVHR